MKTYRSCKRADPRRRGAVLLYVAVIAILLGGLCVSMLTVNMGTSKVRRATQESQRSFYAAEAGLSDAFMQVTEGVIDTSTGTQFHVGTPDEPVQVGDSSYWVAIHAVDSRSLSLTSTGIDGPQQDRLELTVTEEPTGFFQYAAFGADGVLLNGNSFVDSYDSALGPYTSQVHAGNEFARENGHVGSNGDIRLRANTEIHGNATPGPGHVVNDSAANVYVSGSTDPADVPFPMPPIVVPAIPSAGPLNGSGVVTLGPGPVHHSSIVMGGGGTLRIVGPATIVADDFVLNSNTNLVFDTSAGPIEVYGTGDFVLESNSIVTTLSNLATEVTLFLSGDNMGSGGTDDVQLSANSEFIGAIYAPNVRFQLGSNFDVYGSVICQYLDLSSNGEIHFDEALLYDGFGSTDEYAPALWRRLADE